MKPSLFLSSLHSPYPSFLPTAYIQSWEDRPEEIKKLTSQGIIPAIRDLENDDEKGTMEKLMSEASVSFLMQF